MPKVGFNSLTSKLLKVRSIKNDNLDLKITEKYLNTDSAGEKSRINDFNAFKKTEINKIIKFNAERFFQIDEKPICMLKAKSLGKHFFFYLLQSN